MSYECLPVEGIQFSILLVAPHQLHLHERPAGALFLHGNLLLPLLFALFPPLHSLPRLRVGGTLFFFLFSCQAQKTSEPHRRISLASLLGPQRLVRLIQGLEGRLLVLSPVKLLKIFIVDMLLRGSVHIPC